MQDHWLGVNFTEQNLAGAHKNVSDIVLRLYLVGCHCFQHEAR